MSKRWFFTLKFLFGPLPNLGGSVERGYVHIGQPLKGDWKTSSFRNGTTTKVTYDFVVVVEVCDDERLANIVRDTLKGKADYASAIHKILPRPPYGYYYSADSGFTRGKPRTTYGIAQPGDYIRKVACDSNSESTGTT